MKKGRDVGFSSKRSRNAGSGPPSRPWWKWMGHTLKMRFWYFLVVPVKDLWQDPAPLLLHGSPSRDFCFCCHFQTSTSVLFSISPTKQISSHFPSVLCTHLDFNLTPSYILPNLKPVLDQSLFIEFEMLPRELSPAVRYMYSLMMSSTGILHHVHCFMF